MKKTLLLLALCFAANVYQAHACTNFLVGKNATADGSTIISYAADSYSFYGFLRYRSEEDHQPGEMRKVVCWDDGKPLMEIPQAPHTYTVVGNMNQHQLTIGDIAKKLGDRFGVDNRKNASILDTFSCTTQGLLPYGVQMLLAAGLAGCSPMHILPYLYYPMALGVAGILSIAFRFPKQFS